MARAGTSGADARGLGSVRIARVHLLAERGTPVRECPVVDLEQVLGVHLARVRAVVGAGEHPVVAHDDFGVHVVVQRARRVGRRSLRGELSRVDDTLVHRALPRRASVVRRASARLQSNAPGISIS